jgi:uncharacterized protein (TIGR02145 family)/prepilin-type N-terminal cleavage/methylation domain-containing protein
MNKKQAVPRVRPGQILRGFTLIELLVVIAIIGILTTVTTFSVANLRAKSRDTKRITDIKKIQLALENYYRDEQSYPDSINFGSDLVGSISSTTYMAPVPSNPAPQADGNCTTSDYTYENSLSYGYKIQFCLGTANSDIVAGLNCATPRGIIAGVCPFDSEIKIKTLAGHKCNPAAPDYDTCLYPVTKIGTQYWLSKNLNIGTVMCGNTSGASACPDDETNNNVLEKYCYNNDPANCTAYGALYEWPETVQYLNGASTSTNWSPIPNGNIKGICPNGWHLPTTNEWIALNNYLNTNGYAGNEGLALRSSSSWNGSNTFAFNALPAGVRYSPEYGGGYAFINTTSHFWTASSIGSSYAEEAALLEGQSDIATDSTGKTNGDSVRCLKN